MPLLELKNIQPKQLSPGYLAKLIHTGNITLSYINVTEGSVSAEHSHSNEQIAMVLEGIFQLNVEGTPYKLEKGQLFFIPPNVKHGGVAITDCTLLDIFYPEREDFK